MADNPQDSLHFLLGQMSANIQKLVDASEAQHGRVSKIEARVASLEQFKAKAALATVALGTLVPTTVSFLLNKYGGQ